MPLRAVDSGVWQSHTDTALKMHLLQCATHLHSDLEDSHLHIQEIPRHAQHQNDAGGLREDPCRQELDLQLIGAQQCVSCTSQHATIRYDQCTSNIAQCALPGL
jgi:hypothetical protein